MVVEVSTKGGVDYKHSLSRPLLSLHPRAPACATLQLQHRLLHATRHQQECIKRGYLTQAVLPIDGLVGRAGGRREQAVQLLRGGGRRVARARWARPLTHPPGP